MSLELLRNVARGTDGLVTTPSFASQHKGYVEVDRFTPYLGEILVVMKEKVDE